MPTPITWRNVNAQSQNDAARLLQTGSDQLNKGLSTIGSAAGQFQKNKLKGDKALTNKNTENLTNLINSFDTAKLAQAQNSGQFSIENLQQQYGDKVDVAAVTKALDNQDNKIFADSQESVLRENTLNKQADDKYARNQEILRRDHKEKLLAQNDINDMNAAGDVATSRDKTIKIDKDTEIFNNIIRDMKGSGASLNEQLENLEFVAQQNGLDGNALNIAKGNLTTSLNETRKSNKEQAALDSQIQQKNAKTDAQYSIMEQEHRALEATSKRNASLTSDERSKQEASLNRYLSESVDRSWIQDEDEKQALIDFGDEIDASPAQMEAAASRVEATSGGFNLADYKEVLRTIVADPEGELLQERIKASLNNLNAFKIGLSAKKANDKATITQEFEQALGF